MQRASQKNAVQQLVMTGGHVQGDLLAPEDVVSLLIDDAQLEQKLKEIPLQVGVILVVGCFPSLPNTCILCDFFKRVSHLKSHLSLCLNFLSWYFFLIRLGIDKRKEVERKLYV